MAGPAQGHAADMTGCQEIVGERPANAEYGLQPMCIDELGLYIDGCQGGLGNG